MMMDQGHGGKVILVGSVRGQVGLGNYTAYCPSKAAVHLMTKSLGCGDGGPHKINVNCIAPGVFRSEITRRVFEDPAFNKMVMPRFPIGRLGEPEDFAGAVLFLFIQGIRLDDGIDHVPRWRLHGRLTIDAGTIKKALVVGSGTMGSSIA